ncbi:MAG: DNA polymerase III subunit alpha [Candidatus Vogelbacteria bacterium CG10_big_fil_rev_8_21_14_0_10_50_13]|uniref:DNA polymerase III subunit alpha n=1 Tax=Candidatus Vogelbacteria bacterium CG10_big_fil_rev_8_21_14_0_10_50_13 TaxID=1975044 RepID=A0A2H0RGJ8_9BACT|nr:MAG: DNA polymerase III subunit alpha [Candidatus Vogelbacteria bacterium CG10_big_fil_rev_8_21_14_0_10_50_13]
MSFVHLHTHSHYSLLDGLSKTKDLVAKAKSLGMPALAVTDHGNLYGAIDFYEEATKAGLKPIIGVEAYVAARSRFDKEPGIDSKRYHLTLLAENLIGYQNLVKMVTAANLEGYYYKPRIDKELMREHAAGIICLSGCLGGELSRALWEKNKDKAIAIVREHQAIFGENNYFLEIMHHPKLERGLEIKNAIIALARELDLPLVATQDSHYLEPADKPAHETLVAIQLNNLDGEKKLTNPDEDFSFISAETAKKYFADTPEAVANTLKIAERCNLELTLGKFIFPTFPIPAGQTADSLLRELAFAGLKTRNLESDQAAQDRLNHELEIIKMKGYASYFLVVGDLIRHAKERDIYYTIRGSVAGSITTYALGITKINPLEYQIPFERFLNPERPSAPDIDMDFADNRRDEIIDYAKQKYGEDKVAQIGTFGTMMARGAVRDVARALGKPYELGDKIAKEIPLGSQGMPMTIERALKESPELKALAEAEAEVREILNMAKKIEGSVRHISVHAAGVVIAPEPLTNYVPLQYDPKGKALITQYDMYAVGEDGVGLTKFDFLGLRNLAILHQAVRLVRKIHNTEIDLEHIPLDDRKTFDLLARGDTVGLFQLNGTGMTRWLKELKPTTIHDINAMVALYRPGPMQFIPDFIDRKYHPEKIKYLDPALEPILNQTYGILVYQDDLLMMAHNLAGYSWGEVDKFRKAVGKKIPKLMAEQRDKFIKGCVEHSGWSEKKATEIWKWLEPFAAYGFNKAHSASYGRVAYQTAYMKANYPGEFMTAILSAESGDTDKIAEIMHECHRMDLPVLAPDVNESFADFGLIKAGKTPGVREPKHPVSKTDRIRVGLATIKNMGTDIAEAIVDERKAKGPYQSLAQFLERVSHKNMNRKALEALAKTGALDCFGEDRGVILANLEQLVEYHREHSHSDQGQDSLFGVIADQSTVPALTLRSAEPSTRRDRLAWEKELLGLYVSGHPLDDYREQFKSAKQTIASIEKLRDDSVVIFGGIIEEVKPILTKRGDRMAFVRLADFTDTIETVCFADIFARYQEIIAPDNCVAIKGRVSYRGGEPSVIIEGIRLLTPQNTVNENSNGNSENAVLQS